MRFEIAKNTLEIKKPIHLAFEEVSNKTILNKNTVYLSKENLTFPLVVRKWQNGDYFYPTGMQGKKKISKYFKDEKKSLLEKKQTWLLCNSNDDILWIIGNRQDNRSQEKKDSTYLKITLQ